MTNIGTISTSYSTDQGQVRDHNEDFFFFRKPLNEDDESKNGWLCIVADGVGGADAGEIASSFATEKTVEHFLAKVDQKDWGKRLKSAIAAAHDDLCTLIASRDGQKRMGTTLVAAIVVENQVVFANVGDSRAYICRNGSIRQITKDHSLVVKLLDDGIITEEEAARLNISNIILQSIGSEQPPQIDIYPEPLLPGDVILLCSDGLNKHVHDDELAQILTDYEPEKASDTLVKLANERGGFDNITALVLKYGKEA